MKALSNFCFWAILASRALLTLAIACFFTVFLVPVQDEETVASGTKEEIRGEKIYELISFKYRENLSDSFLFYYRDPNEKDTLRTVSCKPGEIIFKDAPYQERKLKKVVGWGKDEQWVAFLPKEFLPQKLLPVGID